MSSLKFRGKYNIKKQTLSTHKHIRIYTVAKYTDTQVYMICMKFCDVNSVFTDDYNTLHYTIILDQIHLQIKVCEIRNFDEKIINVVL